MRFLLCILTIVLVAGCSTPERIGRISKPIPAESETAYVFPFVSTLVPSQFVADLFDDLVDALNDRKPIPGIRNYVIIKEDPSQIPKEWLARQLVVSGEIWSYRENGGCCATELSIRGRLHVDIPGPTPSRRTVNVSADRFFEHDRSTLERERQLLSRDFARIIYRTLLAELDR